jgi:hypothetical protein
MNVIQELQEFTGDDELYNQLLLAAQSSGDGDSDGDLPDAAESGVPVEFSLDSLLAESMEAISKEQGMRAARKRLARGDVGEVDRLAIEATLKKWDMERVWLAQASVVLFAVQQCHNCGASHRHFVGYFERQSHRTSKIMRWQRVEYSSVVMSGLPRESKEETEQVALCYDCSQSLGWEA